MNRKMLGIVACLGLSLLQSVACSDTQGVRPPAVANSFYPGNPDELLNTLDNFFAKTIAKEIDGEIIALVVPHAGYPYSGQIAANAYRQVQGKKYDLVVILAPSHHDPFYGATIYPGKAYATPLGNLDIDHETGKKLVGTCDLAKYSELGHQSSEHSLEVQLPFIQKIFGNVPILPVVIGQYDWLVCKKIGEALASCIKSKKALIIASSDLYHGYSYSECVQMDGQTLAAIKNLDPEKMTSGVQQEKIMACGAGPIITMQAAAKALGADKAEIIATTNSGDVTGQKQGYIVGYGAVAIYQRRANKDACIEFSEIDVAIQRELLRMARQAISHFLTKGTILSFEPTCAVMKEKRGVFVTITKNGELRGCIGYHEADRPLYELVPDRAIQAAFNDPRFPPLQPEELDQVKIKISVYLTNVYGIDSLDEFVMGKHGIIMVKNGRGATFLPEVPLEVGWKSKDEEMMHLCSKAGLPLDAWKNGAKFWVYRTQIFDENIL